MANLRICRTLNSLLVGVISNKTYVRVPNVGVNRSFIPFLVKKRIIWSAVLSADFCEWTLGLKRFMTGQAITSIKLCSRPGWPKFLTAFELNSLLHKYPTSIFVLYTAAGGYMLGTEALSKGQGGELLFIAER